jgi:hypothetical protein
MLLAAEPYLFIIDTITLPELEILRTMAIDAKINTNGKINTNAKIGMDPEINIDTKTNIDIKIDINKLIIYFLNTLE